MHHLPEGLFFVLVGYYYDRATDELLSLKSGVLRPIKKREIWIKRNPRNRKIGWQISHLGKSRVIIRDVLINRCDRGKLPLTSVIGVVR